MKTFLLPFLSLLTSIAIAETHSRFPIKPSSEWHINFEYCCGFGNNDGDEEYKYFIDGDTVIKNIDYFKLYKTGIIYLETPLLVEHKYIGAIRDTSNIFYFVKDKSNTVSMLYDFNIKVGDIANSLNALGDLHISSIDTLADGRMEFHVIEYNAACEIAHSMIEGIGWRGGLLEGLNCAHHGSRAPYLMCYSEEGNTVYYNTNDLYRKHNDCAVSTEIALLKQRPCLSISTTTDKKLKISIEENNNSGFHIEIYNIQGTKVLETISDLTNGIDVKNLNTGLYIVSVSNNKIALSGKFIIH